MSGFSHEQLRALGKIFFGGGGADFYTKRGLFKKNVGCKLIRGQKQFMRRIPLKANGNLAKVREPGRSLHKKMTCD